MDRCFLPRFDLLQLIIVALLVIHTHCGPGTIYYRKPTKLVFHKKHPPVLIYPKHVDYIPSTQKLKPLTDTHAAIAPLSPTTTLDLHQNGLPTKHTGKSYFLLNPEFLDHLIAYEKQQQQPGWFDWLFGSGSDTIYPSQHAGTTAKFNAPIVSYYYPKKYLKPYAVNHAAFDKYRFVLHQPQDIKPIVEHIEDDIKYDFRTKTHSYQR